MGMFDYVEIEFECPVCEKPIRGFQTKGLNNMLYNYSVGDEIEERTLYHEENSLMVKRNKIELHEVCMNCDTFVSLELQINDNKITDNAELSYFVPRNKDYVVGAKNDPPNVYTDFLEKDVLSYEEYKEKDVGQMIL